MHKEQLSLIDTRRAIYQFLAEVLLSPIAVPGHDFVDKLFAAPLSFDHLVDDTSPDYAEGSRLLKQCADRYAHGNREDLQKEIAVDRTRLFRGAGPTHGAPPPPYEALYLAPQKETDHLLKIVTFYQKAGLKVSERMTERMDYLGIELAFMAELCGREHAMASRKDPANHREVLAQEKEFLENHMLRWVPEYCRQVAELAKTDFFKGIAFLLRGFLNEELEWIDAEE